jgi:very-short-patch-repair endonuclease
MVPGMERVFVGSEAIRSGRLTEYQLRKHHRRLLPDVYAQKGLPLTLTDRAAAAWLWSGRQSVIAGVTASGLHGADYVGEQLPVELIWPSHRAPPGVITRNDTVLPGETRFVGPLPVTTSDRTAFDIARRGPVWEAVARLDALTRAAPFKAADVVDLAANHPHVRGLRRIEEVLDLVDAGAESPKETWLRLVLIRGGYPRPQTQIPVLSPGGYPRYRLDMGWPELMIAVEYDGDQHRVDPVRYRSDIIRAEYIEQVGWRRLRVVAGDRAPDIIRRVGRIWPG